MLLRWPLLRLPCLGRRPIEKAAKETTRRRASATAIVGRRDVLLLRGRSEPRVVDVWLRLLLLRRHLSVPDLTLLRRNLSVPDLTLRRWSTPALTLRRRSLEPRRPDGRPRRRHGRRHVSPYAADRVDRIAALAARCGEGSWAKLTAGCGGGAWTKLTAVCSGGPWAERTWSRSLCWPRSLRWTRCLCWTRCLWTRSLWTSSLCWTRSQSLNWLAWGNGTRLTRWWSGKRPTSLWLASVELRGPRLDTVRSPWPLVPLLLSGDTAASTAKDLESREALLWCLRPTGTEGRRIYGTRAAIYGPHGGTKAATPTNAAPYDIIVHGAGA